MSSQNSFAALDPDDKSKESYAEVAGQHTRIDEPEPFLELGGTYLGWDEDSNEEEVSNLLKQVNKEKQEAEIAELELKVQQEELEASKAEEEQKRLEQETNDARKKKLEELQIELQQVRRRKTLAHNATEKLKLHTDGYNVVSHKPVPVPAPANTTQEAVPVHNQCVQKGCRQPRFELSTKCVEHTPWCWYETNSRCTNPKCWAKHQCRSGKCSSVGTHWIQGKAFCSQCVGNY